MSSDFATGLDLFADVLLNPIFPPANWNANAKCRLPASTRSRDDLLKSASLAMRRAIVRRPGYGLDSLGTEETVEKLPGRRSEIVSPTARRAGQLRPGHLRRRESG